MHSATTAQHLQELTSLDDEARARGRAIAARIALARARWEGLRDGRILTIAPVWSTPDRRYGYDVLVGTSQPSEDPPHAILARWLDAHVSADSAAIQRAPALAWINVSASDAQPPILASGRGVPPTLGSLAAAAEIAIALTGAREVRLQRVYATGVLGRLYEYAAEESSWMVTEGPPWRYGDVESVRALDLSQSSETYVCHVPDVADVFLDYFQSEEPTEYAHVMRTYASDVAGRRVRTLIDAPTGAGTHLVWWRGDDESGHRVGAGVYFVQLGVAGHEEFRSVVWLR